MADPKFDSQSPKGVIAALKQQWRLRLKEVRQTLPLHRRNQASEQACLQINQRSQKARWVLSFASFGSEIDLWPLNQVLADENRLILPRVDAEKGLQLFQVTHLDQLECHRWGMLEPNISECTPVDLSLIEIALIPGLGFDPQTKYRLGYGQGYYDRLLASIPSLSTWGIGFLEQAVENLPYSCNDIPLHQIDLF